MYIQVIKVEVKIMYPRILKTTYFRENSFSIKVRGTPNKAEETIENKIAVY
jgi:hypothetical protein